MKNLLSTNSNNWSALIARLALGLVVFPHGAQKLLGWFGGYGFEGTMGFLTTQAGLSYLVALLVILIESIAALFVIFGFFTRVSALGIFGLFTGIVFKIHAANGFFMNWAGNQKGEGIEYFLLLLGLALVLIITGGGKGSVDAALTGKVVPANA
jgi:putative oxidoreductase